MWGAVRTVVLIVGFTLSFLFLSSSPAQANTLLIQDFPLETIPFDSLEFVVISIIFSFIVTVLIEFGVHILARIKSDEAFKALVLTNAFTVPAFEILTLVHKIPPLPIIVATVFFELVMLSFLLNENHKFRKVLLAVLLSNAVSFTVGALAGQTFVPILASIYHTFIGM